MSAYADRERVGLEPTYENVAGSSEVLDSLKVLGGTDAHGVGAATLDSPIRG